MSEPFGIDASNVDSFVEMVWQTWMTPSHVEAKYRNSDAYAAGIKHVIDVLQAALKE